eukprot:Rhum_TRINITY_DN14529_c11_g1::Rhum_TRINITY_DN14529_c11_g1_i1::g.96891::m.96891
MLSASYCSALPHLCLFAYAANPPPHSLSFPPHPWLLPKKKKSHTHTHTHTHTHKNDGPPRCHLHLLLPPPHPPRPALPRPRARQPLRLQRQRRQPHTPQLARVLGRRQGCRPPQRQVRRLRGSQQHRRAAPVHAAAQQGGAPRGAPCTPQPPRVGGRRRRAAGRRAPPAAALSARRVLLRAAVLAVVDAAAVARGRARRQPLPPSLRAGGCVRRRGCGARGVPAEQPVAAVPRAVLLGRHRRRLVLVGRDAGAAGAAARRDVPARDPGGASARVGACGRVAGAGLHLHRAAVQLHPRRAVLHVLPQRRLRGDNRVQRLSHASPPSAPCRCLPLYYPDPVGEAVRRGEAVQPPEAVRPCAALRVRGRLGGVRCDAHLHRPRGRGGHAVRCAADRVGADGVRGSVGRAV